MLLLLTREFSSAENGLGERMSKSGGYVGRRGMKTTRVSRISLTPVFFLFLYPRENNFVAAGDGLFLSPSGARAFSFVKKMLSCS